MNASLKQMVRRFHITGDAEGEPLAEHGLSPALLAPYRDLTALRYDYPLVLARGDAVAPCVYALSHIIDGILQVVAPAGIEGERMRKHCLRLEARIRALAGRRVVGSLADLWDVAAVELVSESDEVEAQHLTEDLHRARRELTVDGRLIDCDENAAAEVFKHVWRCIQRARNAKALRRLDELELKLSQILEADFHNSDAARTPESLQGSMGASVDDAIDFTAMAEVLNTGSRASSFTDRRRQRIRAALTVLRSQRFFTREASAEDESHDGAPNAVVFPSCADAWEAFVAQIPAKIELLKAIATAELEIGNQFDESEHDRLLAGFSEQSLTQEDLDFFPSYLVTMRNEDCRGDEKAKLIDVLSSGLPVKVLVETDDILEEPSLAAGQFAFGAQCQQLATMAVGLNDAFVLQSTSSNLYQAQERIQRGLAHDGPALFSIFTGLAEDVSDLPRYLTAACATQSRAFPTFTYDPAQGEGLAARFEVEDNPQATVDWPVQHFSYEDEDLQRISEDVALTFAEFAACDKRHARFFVTVPRSDWNEALVPASEFLALAEDETRDKVPCVLMVDADDVLHKRVVDDKLIRAAKRCLGMWHNLQEQGGIHNSHALRLLERERSAWEQEKDRALAELKSKVDPDIGDPGGEPGMGQEVVAEAAAVEPEPAPAPEEERSTDEPYIETPRCTTCDECTDLNNKMFIYDENKQAYIADLSAGTYRELVEAAEICQVAVIHPGKPHDSNEPGLSDLIQRADEFN